MKKFTISVIAAVFGLSMVGGKALAAETNEVLAPDSDLYKTTRIMESVSFELTEDPVNKAILQAEFADERLSEIDIALKNGDQELVKKLLGDYNVSLTAFNELIKKTDDSKASSTLLAQADILSSDHLKKRSQHLLELLQRQDLPAQAKQGIENALQNQEIAYKSFLEAQSQNSDIEKSDETSDDTAVTETAQENQTVETESSDTQEIKGTNKKEHTDQSWHSTVKMNNGKSEEHRSPKSQHDSEVKVPEDDGQTGDVEKPEDEQKQEDQTTTVESSENKQDQDEQSSGDEVKVPSTEDKSEAQDKKDEEVKKPKNESDQGHSGNHEEQKTNDHNEEDNQ